MKRLVLSMAALAAFGLGLTAAHAGPRGSDAAGMTQSAAHATDISAAKKKKKMRKMRAMRGGQGRDGKGTGGGRGGESGSGSGARM